MRICYKCFSTINECFGSVKADDFLKAVAGEIPWAEVKELCPKCATKKIFEETLDNQLGTCYTTQ